MPALSTGTRLPLVALAAALSLAGCNQAPKTTDNDMVSADNALSLSDTPANSDAPVIEDASSDATPAVAVPDLPTPAASVSKADVGPLNDAGTIERQIRAGDGIQRLRYGHGWAWMRDGHIVRTANKDGSNVAYFHPSDSAPFFVQRGDHGYAYQGDKPVRVFDHNGQVRAPDDGGTREAEDARKDAGKLRDDADHALQYALPPAPGTNPKHPSPEPAASPTSDGNTSSRHDRGEDNRNRL